MGASVSNVTIPSNGNHHQNDNLMFTFMPTSMPAHALGSVDYAVLVILTTLSAMVGTMTAVREVKVKTAKEFLSGGRSMNPIPVTFSLLGGVVSALSILGNGTEMYLYGTQLSMNLLGCVWGVLIVTSVILPVLYPLELVSMYQYLQMRFKSKVIKKTSSLTQTLNSFFFLGICLYAPSLALSSVTSIPTWASIVFMGILCSLYVAVGGVRAVVYTDVLQTSVMLIGVLVVIAKTIIEVGGFGSVWDIAGKGGRLEFFNFDPNPLVRHTFWSVQVLGTYFIVSVMCLSQAQFQRLMSVRDVTSSIRICYAFLVGLFILWSLFNLCGLVAYATYAGCDPLSTGKIEKPDQIIPYMVVEKVGRSQGLAGLFLAAVYGGVLSSVSSVSNAISTNIWEDFLVEKRYFATMSDASATTVTKILTALCGVVSIGFAFLVSNLGTLFQLAYSIGGAIVGPLDGLFLTGILAPWVNTSGAICGFLGSLILNIFLLVGKFHYGAGSSQRLPLSTESCLSDIDLSRLGQMSNGTSVSLLHGTTDSMSSTFNLTTGLYSSTTTQGPPTESQREYLAIFDLSYCYQGVLGIFLTLTISTIFSYPTGFTNPRDVDPRLFHPRCLRLYTDLWDRYHGRHQEQIIMQEDDSLPHASGGSPRARCSSEDDDESAELFPA